MSQAIYFKRASHNNWLNLSTYMIYYIVSFSRIWFVQDFLFVILLLAMREQFLSFPLETIFFKVHRYCFPLLCFSTVFFFWLKRIRFRKVRTFLETLKLNTKVRSLNQYSYNMTVSWRYLVSKRKGCIGGNVCEFMKMISCTKEICLSAYSSISLLLLSLYVILSVCFEPSIFIQVCFSVSCMSKVYEITASYKNS